jgi:hypothetical protein
MKSGSWKAIVNEVNTFLDVTFLDEICEEKPLRRHRSEPNFKQLWSHMNGTSQKSYAMDGEMLHTESQTLGCPSEKACSAIQWASESCSSDFSDASTADLCCAPSAWSSESGASDAPDDFGASDSDQVIPQSSVETADFKKMFTLLSSQTTCDDGQSSHHDVIGADASTSKRKKTRPSKTMRQRYHAFIDNVMQQILINPQEFDFDLLALPAWLAKDEDARERLKIRFQECQAYALLRNA